MSGPPSPKNAPFLGVALISMSVLVLQIALTRLFSFTIWYHFAYVTISVALLGYGASGSFLAVAPRFARSELLPRFALAGGAASVGTLLVVAWVPFHPFQLWEDASHQVPWLILTYLGVTAPFFLAGVTIAAALRGFPATVSRLYFFDLLGAGLGCLVVVGAIWTLSTPGAVALAGGLMAVSAVPFARSAGLRPMPWGAAAAALLASGGLLAGGLAFAPSPEKFLALMMGNPEEAVISTRRWTPIYRTDVFWFKDEEASRGLSYAGWGVSPHWKEEAKTRSPRIRFFAHDGDACAVMYEFNGDLDELELFDHHILGTPYEVLEEPEVLVIGLGGGADIVNALRHRARHVTGVELDPVTVEVVRTEQAEFTGRIYERDDVTALAGEGRSTLRHSGRTYDLIQLSAVDTMAALSTGAYVLAESYLYTVEAFEEFLDHLNPNGIVSMMVADHDEDFGLPRHTIRQLALFVEALDRRGVERPQDHIAVLASGEGTPQVVELLKAAPFLPDEVERLRRYAEREGFEIWALPGEEGARIHSKFLHMSPSERRAWLDDAPLLMHATTDDNPFFFNFYRWRDLGRKLGEVDTGHTLATAQIVMSFILGQSILFAGLLILGPLLLFRRRGLRIPGALGFALYFSALGLGFILLEISFVQKLVLFLGYPTYSLTVVLFSLLVFSGLGSLATGRWATLSLNHLVRILAFVALLGIAYAFGLPVILDSMLGAPFPVRVLATVLLLLPLGVPLGMFFPTGIAIVSGIDREFVPWAWGINGSASVVGTILAVILAMSYGFRFVTFVALAVYGVGIAGLALALRRGQSL